MSGRVNEKLKGNSYIIPSILMSIIIVAILSSFGLRMIDEAKDNVTGSYLEDTNDISTLYEKEIFAVEKTAEILSNELASKELGILDDESLLLAETFASTMKLRNIILVDDNFHAKDINGKEYDQINNIDHFKFLFDSKNDFSKFASNAREDKSLYIMSAITTEKSLKGYVIIEYVPNVIENLINDPRYSSTRTYALVSSEGDVIEVAGEESKFLFENANVIDNAQNMVYVGKGSYTSFRQSIYDCRTSSLQIIYKEDGYYVFSSPISGTKAISMMLVKTEDVDRSFAAVSKVIRNMFFEIGITIIVFFLIFFVIALFNRAKYSIESEDLQNKADTDLLTDLYNKMATERLIKEYMEGEGKNSVSMLFILDVDDFKKINDTKGHAFGDQVLSQLGHQIRAWFRVNDIVGRVGGDEFMIFIKDVKDPEAIKREGSRIMQFFDGFNVGEYAKYSPTASVGGAVFPNDGSDFDSLYRAADKAVYKSKKEGKNRVSFYSDLNSKEKDADTSKKI